MKKATHVYMLPGNTSERDDVQTEPRVGKPIGLIVKRPPKLLESVPSTPPSRVNDEQEIDFKEFPLLRGFV